MKLDLFNIRKGFLITSAAIIIVIIISVYFIFSAVASNKVAFRTPVRVLHNPKITWAVPEAETKKSGSSNWVAVEPGQRLNSESSIRTGSFGNVDISFEEGTLIRVAENTFVKLSELSLLKVSVSLEQGSVISKFRKIAGTEIHKIITPDVVCGIRGTELIVEINDSETVVYGMSGVTEVASVNHPENPVLLGFQQKTITPKGQIPVSPVNMTADEIKYYRRQLDSMHSSEVFFITSDLKFEPDSAELISDSAEVLQDLARVIKRKRLSLEIVGHTADVGDRSSQYALSQKRSEAVKEALISMGVKEKRLITTGYGGSKPIADNNTEEGRASNRRVEFLINNN